ncbi:glycosyltransferase family 39 protein [Pedobacter heparinus]|uniref:Glycosyltransferase RgtA/B/C/D-like domain-containing protein n=1 Tax=Pedobacter heparinus (strain ATCC 13125 / DSM 2366 / CIP 104194 / JCM 7457 / NBRC 12017 / NCIMB 9290 / NRRL B-14731 / HIM 762-3) TaxID=485917 RepID=C6XWA3_PEDHD|nr:glycosyltransferase family 39 protein [Pedobacter heparinus]ACU04182.1 hypothetical protein Phep_1974 [Pedobacter heparinus DSM 2366]
MRILVDRIYNQKENILKTAILIISLLGIGLRIFHLIYNRSLWMDEIYLCSSFFHLDYLDLAAGTLDYGQKAPIGFLWAVKFITNIFGYSEISFRIIPFISGIVSVLLFIKVCRYFLKPEAQLLAVVIFSFAPAMIYHSTEIKQYATECLATLLALYLFTIYANKTDYKSMLLWAAFGAVLLWFSYSVIFILTGMAMAIIINHLLKKNHKSLLINTLPFVTWMISFLINYVFFTYKQKESEWVVYWFKAYDYFMPFPPVDLQGFKWFGRNLLSMLDYPLGLNWNVNEPLNNMAKLLFTPIVPLMLLCTGIYSLARKNKEVLGLILIPCLLVLIASGLKLYPLRERFWMFLAPIFILLIGFGFEYLKCKFRSVKKIGMIVLLLTIAGPIIQSAYFLVYPAKFYKHKKSFEQEALSFINRNYKDGDMVYNYWNNYPGYNVYRQINTYRYTAIQGKDYRFEVHDLNAYNQKLKSEFTQFKGAKRLWVVFNTQFTTTINDLVDQPVWYYKGDVSPVINFERQISSQGKLITKIVYSDLTVCLFELIH